ncbi:MAG: hypothetical protein B7C55_07525 [Actinomycetales bacterium mxb001]|nr:MAG: hypothetical protein B7C55_07525 [Actinomycetales bacterium mxb001]
MERAEAAALLGVGVDATPDEVRRAWRLWAREMHPDRGGSRRDFERLSRARALLLAPLPVAPAMPAPSPRRSWRDVIVIPDGRGLLLVVGLVVVSVVAVLVAPLGPMPWSLAGAAAAAAATSVVAGRIFLRGPDLGHVIVARFVAWLAVTSLQCVVGAIAGIAVIEALPLLAVPFVAGISLLNPGAGLWRPSRSARGVNVR